MSTNSSKLSLTSRASSSFTRVNPPVNRSLIFESYCQHLRTLGKLTFDIEKSKLKFSVRGTITVNFIKCYGNIKEFEVMKENIGSCESANTEDSEGVKKYLFRINVNNEKPPKNEKIFVFMGANKDNEKNRDKFVAFIKGMRNGYIELYKSEFNKLNKQAKKKISFFMKNKDLLILYKRLSKIYDPEKILLYIKYMHPGKININFGQNRIQLSRDEELLISILFPKRIDVDKLLSSEISINELYYQKKAEKGFNPNDFWASFYNAQKENKAYIVGEYKPIKLNNNYNEEVNDNNLIEELEKDKYYYDTYETNYLYNEYEADVKTTINNYSINKMKEIKYFSYSPQNINLFNSIKNSNKNKQPKKNVSSNQNLSEEMDTEKDDNTNEINKLKRIPKLELLKRITKMKKDFQENSNTNNSKTTIKEINQEVEKVYNLANIMNTLNNSADDITETYKKIFLVRDLSFIYKNEFSSYERVKDKINPEKKKEKNAQFQHIRNEINNLINQVKRREGQYDKKPLINFLIKYAEYNSIN